MRKALSISFLSLLVAGSIARGADWPQWRGPDRDGKSKDTGLLKKWPKGGPKLLWTFAETGVGYSSPSIIGDRLYIFGAEKPEKGEEEFVLCISTKDGKQIWKKAIDPTPGKFDFGDYSRGNGPRSSPVIDGKFLYFLGAKGDLACLETEDGKVVWQKHLVKDFGGQIPAWGYSESILIDGDHLICTPGGKKGTLAALKKSSGEVVWRSADVQDEAQYASIEIGNVGEKQYIQMSKKGVFGVNAADGKLLWRSKAGGNGIAVCTTPIVDDKYVFATSGYGTGCGLVELTAEAKGVKEKDVYITKTLQNHHGGVIRLGDYIYGHSDSGGWMCLQFKKDGDDPVWKFNGFDKGSILYADDRFYCYSEKNGNLVMIEASPKKWIEVSRLELPKKSKFERRGAIWTHPVIANGKLYLRDHELLFCFDVADIQ